jgi:O-antigen/teichoic acid export membrane protein
LKFPKFISHISSYQFFQLFRYGALMLIGILFSKSHLGINEIGSYETLMLLSSVFTFFWISGLMNSMLSLFNKEIGKTSFFFNSFLLVCLFNGIIVVLMVAFKPDIIAWFCKGKDIPYYNLLLVYIFLNTPSFLNEHIFLLRKESNKLITYGSSIYSLQVIFAVAPIFFGYSIEMSLYGLIGIAIIKLIILASLLIKHSLFEINFTQLKSHLYLALPLMASALFSGSADYIDGIIVSRNFSPNVFAIFRFGARELPFTLLMANAMSVALVPIFSSGELKESLAEIKRRSTRLMHVLFPITILLLLTSKIIYPIVFNAQFIDSARVFNVFLMLIISRMVFPQTILTGLRKTRIIMLAAFIEIIINVASSLILLQYFGIIGVAMGTVVAYFSEKLILVLYAYYFLRIKPSEYFQVAVLSMYSAILIVCYVFVEVLG